MTCGLDETVLADDRLPREADLFHVEFRLDIGVEVSGTFPRIGRESLPRLSALCWLTGRSIGLAAWLRFVAFVCSTAPTQNVRDDFIGRLELSVALMNGIPTAMLR